MKTRRYNDEKVLTLKDIDEIHKRPPGTASRNFHTNREHFTEGEDYYLVKRKDVEGDNKVVGIKPGVRGTLVLTQKGYMLLTKTFQDPLSWEVQRGLMGFYRRVTKDEDISGLSPELKELKEKINIILTMEEMRKAGVPIW